MIVEPEYEAAWKQAERAFQDILKLALADTSAERRSKSIIDVEVLQCAVWVDFPILDSNAMTLNFLVFSSECKTDISQVRSSTHDVSSHGSGVHAITELAESQASDRTVMSIAGHVSQQMLAHYSHVRIEAKRKALDALSVGVKRCNLLEINGTDSPSLIH